MNYKKIFNIISKHMLEQKVRSSNEDGLCFYKCEDGRMCAIGCILPDDHPGLKLHCNIEELLKLFPDLRKVWDIRYKDDIIFLKELQLIHDKQNPLKWKEYLKKFAEKYHIKFSFTS